MSNRVAHVARLAMPLVVACSCQDKGGSKTEAAIAAIGSTSLAVNTPPPLVSASAQVQPEKPIVHRPKDQGDLVVTDERRARVERAIPEARGFLTSAALEEKLYRLNLKRGKDSDAVKAFDRLAKGKWVLFVGNIGAVSPERFELPIRYTPKDPNDPLGLTAVWIPIELTKIKDYDANQYEPGELAVVLAKYEGSKKASGGYDLVFSKHWFQ